MVAFDIRNRASDVLWKTNYEGLGGGKAPELKRSNYCREVFLDFWSIRKAPLAAKNMATSHNTAGNSWSRGLVVDRINARHRTETHNIARLTKKYLPITLLDCIL